LLPLPILTIIDSPSFTRKYALYHLVYYLVFMKISTASQDHSKTSLISHYPCPTPTLYLTENLVLLNMLTELLINTKNVLIYLVYTTKIVCSLHICFSDHDCKCYEFRRKLSDYL